MKCYRPISVLPLLSKVLERHIFDSVYKYLTCNDVISQRQSGFRKHHSCQTLLIRITDYLLDNMDKGRILGLTMVDLRKAFNLVNHKTLLQKLTLYGLDDNALAWFTSYLSNREFYVSIDNHMSDKATIASGVPQGSILDPLLFVIYMNDLPLRISNSNVELFADDATLYASASTVNEVEQQLGDETIPLVQWINDNSMVLSKLWRSLLRENMLTYANLWLQLTGQSFNLFGKNVFLVYTLTTA